MDQSQQDRPDDRRPAGEQRAGDAKKSGMTPSVSPNNSFDEGAGEENTGFDSPAIGSQTLSNEEYLELEKQRDRASTTGETGEGIEPGDTAHEAE